MKSKKKYMSLKEFRTEGYLHELNRQFLHPLGLALEIKVDDEGNDTFGGIWDCRDDPDGIMFEALIHGKIDRIKKISEKRYNDRVERLGFWVQGNYEVKTTTEPPPKEKIVSKLEGSQEADFELDDK